MKLFSVISINYNNRPGLADTFASVFRQSFSDFEYIVIDGGSTDGSAGLIEEHAANIDHWVSEKDSGIYDAMNKGIAAASGDYLIFLNSGDCFQDAGTLEECIRYLKQSPDADILYADIYMIGGLGTEPELYTHPASVELKYFKKHVLNQQASLFKATLFEEFGPFPACYALAGDYWLYLRSFIAGKLFTFMDFVMVRFDSTGLSFSSGEKYIVERNDIWKTLVPEPMRRGIDNREKLAMSKLGRAFNRLLSTFR